MRDLSEIIWEDIYGVYTDTPLSRIEAILLSMLVRVKHIETLMDGGSTWKESPLIDSNGQEILDSNGNNILGRIRQ
ncbi:MAG: hypothetical protein II699_05205 [Lachnospiraceae bacterium]|nr:hypothetical protein [Lachnospiraceae bacterium]